MPRQRQPRVRLTPLLHALFFVAAATQNAIVPLLPRLNHAYGLSPASDALLLAAPGLATLAVSMPAGAFADRLGARRVTIAATVLMAIAAMAQAAPDYSVLIAGRFAFGVAYGILWTTGVAWLAASQVQAGSPQLGAVATSAAVGMVAGPAIGGLLADQIGLAAPFLIVAAVGIALALALAAQPAPASGPTHQNRPSPKPRDLARLVNDHPGVLTAAAVLATRAAAASG
jgi:predicted MFS family arabinose efflux permease